MKIQEHWKAAWILRKIGLLRHQCSSEAGEVGQLTADWSIDMAIAQLELTWSCKIDSKAGPHGEDVGLFKRRGRG